MIKAGFQRIKKRYSLIALGGTFDHLHQGHEKFLQFAASLSDKLAIGITDGKLAKNKNFNNSIQDLKLRKNNLIKFLKSQNISFELVILKNIYGNTLENKNIQALVVTKETLRGAEKINQAREAINLKKLDIYICDYALDESGNPIHSERIRAGEINRQGKVYLNYFKKNIKLNNKQRQFFSKPIANLADSPQQNPSQLICVVGDIALNKFLKNNWGYDLAVYDKKTGRKKFDSKLINKIKPNLIIKNPAGFLTQDLFEKLKLSLNKKYKHIFVDGEEDLATVALVILLPLGAYIYYGQPDQGLVEVKVTEKLKEKVFEILI